MTQSDKAITRDNAFDIIKLFAKEYRKVFGKTPAEIIIVGGGSIMLNYKFRDATQDFDVILKAASGTQDIIKTFADNNGLPRDWMNSDFMKTESYSNVLSEVSKHYRTLNNGTLEIRTVSGVYLIAMKLRAHRAYRNDISDAVGIMIEETEAGNCISFEDICAAYTKLYNEQLDGQVADKMSNICGMTLLQMKEYYNKQNLSEREIKEHVVEYIRKGVSLNTKNVSDVIDRIRAKMGDNFPDNK